MLRIDALKEIYPLLQDHLVVTIMGAVAAELYSLGHRPNFFYLEHAMGLASSTGLGLSLSLPNEKVIVLDGDGSILMNLGSLSTLARYRPRNLTLVIFDNESLLSVGGFPTATSTGTDLAGVARASGVRQTATANTVQEFAHQFREALNADDLAVLVTKVDAVGPPGFHMDLALLENRFQFQRHIKSLEEE